MEDAEKLTDLGIPKDQRPECRLTDTDGNVYAIIGRINSTLKRAHFAQKAKEFTSQAIQMHSYDEVLQLCFKYVKVL